MKKIFMLGLVALFAVTIVSAGFLVNSFVLTTDVYEPFQIEYAIVGDAGNWYGTTDCDTYAGEWQVGADVDVGGLYAGEGRVICTKITNLGEGDVDYTFSAEVMPGQGNFVECEAAFGNPSVEGTALGSTTTKDGTAVVVADDATPVDDCLITLSVSRGSND